MKEIYECNDILDLETINFWTFIKNKINRCINGKCEIFYNFIKREVIIKTYFPKLKLCYSFNIPLITNFKNEDIIKMVYQSLHYNIFHEFFNDNLYKEIEE